MGLFGSSSLFKETNNVIGSADGISAGVSWKGVDAYLEQINLNKDNIIKKLQDVSGIQKAIDAGWQGQSKIAFYKDLETSINRAVQQVKDEAEDLKYRVYEIRDNFYNQDASMYKE